MGNCTEHSSASFYYLKNNKQITSIDELRMVYADHIFLLIGREPGSSPYDVKTWGKSCVVCNAWPRRIYPLSDLDYHLKNICNIYNLTIKDNDFTLKIGANGRKFLEPSSSLPPSLSPKKSFLYKIKSRLITHLNTDLMFMKKLVLQQLYLYI